MPFLPSFWKAGFFETRQSGESSDDSPNVEGPSMVPDAVGGLCGQPHSVPQHPQSPSQPKKGESSNGAMGQPTSSRLAWVRDSLRSKGFSDKTTEIMCASWRRGTEKSNSSTWRKWHSWCRRRDADPFSAPLSEITEFLTTEFEAGKQYSTLNFNHTAISSTHPAVDGHPVGQTSSPSLPEGLGCVTDCQSYTVNAINSRHDTKGFNAKLVMLIALTNADRESDLHALDLRYLQSTPEGVIFSIPGPTKTRQSGAPREVTYNRFTENPEICPVATLQVYREKTESWREPIDIQLLYVSINKPHHAVTAAIILR